MSVVLTLYLFEFMSFRLKDLSIRIKDNAKSYVWKSFGLLTDKSGKVVNPDQIYCSVCFDKGTVKHYKQSVSTTNMAQHLRDVHGILFPNFSYFS